MKRSAILAEAGLTPLIEPISQTSAIRAVTLAMFTANTLNESDRITRALATAPSRQARRHAERELKKFAKKRGLAVPGAPMHVQAKPSRRYFDRLPDGRLKLRNITHEQHEAERIEPAYAREPAMTMRPHRAPSLRRVIRAKKRQALETLRLCVGDHARLIALTEWRRLTGLGTNEIARIVGPIVGDLISFVMDSRSAAQDADAAKHQRIMARIAKGAPSGVLTR